MYRTATAITAGCVAALAFAAPTPALATTAVPAIHNGEAGMVQEVAKKKDKKWTKHDRNAYSQNPRYPAYRYSDRRYAYDYDDDYYYDSPRRRSGVNLHLDF